MSKDKYTTIVWEVVFKNRNTNKLIQFDCINSPRDMRSIIGINVTNSEVELYKGISIKDYQNGYFVFKTRKDARHYKNALIKYTYYDKKTYIPVILKSVTITASMSDGNRMHLGFLYYVKEVTHVTPIAIAS